MRKIKQIFMLLCAGCALEAWLCACEGQADIPVADGKTTTVTLRIGTNSSEGVATRAENSNVQPYEGLRTLRVIVTDAGMSAILRNEKFTIDDSTSPTNATLQTNVTLKDIPLGNANIYLIANEESLGVEYTDAVMMENITNNKLEVIDNVWAHFPKTYEEIAKHGLPMSAKAENVEITGNDAISMRLDRAVVKVHLTVENATSDVLILEWVKFGKFISDRFFMFREVQLDIPKDTQYKDLRYPENEQEIMNVTLEANASTQWNSIYIYPNFAYSNPEMEYPYTLSLKTEKYEYPASRLAQDMNSLIRNTQLNITARITASAYVVINYAFVPWAPETIDVPPFN